MVLNDDIEEEDPQKEIHFSSLSDEDIPNQKGLENKPFDLKASERIISFQNQANLTLGDQTTSKGTLINTGSSRAIKRFEDKLALKAKSDETENILVAEKRKSVFLNQTSQRRIPRRNSSVNPLLKIQLDDKKELDEKQISDICDLRRQFLENSRNLFQDMMLRFETEKRESVKNLKKDEDDTEEFFNFKAFEQCYQILDVQTTMQKIIFTMVYWWPVMLAEHLLILINCGYLCSLSAAMSKSKRYTIFWLNAVLTGYLLVCGVLRLYLIKRASKQIKREYFIFLDIGVGVLSALELILGSIAKGEPMPSSFLVFMIVRVMLKAYSVSLSTSLKELLAQVRKTMTEILYFLIILLVIILLFVFIGMTLFGEGTLADSSILKNRVLRSANFGSFADGIFTVFMILTLENWVPTFFEYRQKFNSVYVTIYFAWLS